MKEISIANALYKALENDAKRRRLSVDELVAVILKREYKIK
jgi:predicted DNA-binding ribbon-helix-helix protein